MTHAGTPRLRQALDLLEPRAFARLRARATAVVTGASLLVSLIGLVADGSRPGDTPLGAWTGLWCFGVVVAAVLWWLGERAGEAAFFAVVGLHLVATVWTAVLVQAPQRGIPMELMLLAPVALAAVFCRDGRFLAPIVVLACLAAVVIALEGGRPVALVRSAMGVGTVLAVGAVVRVLRTTALEALDDARALARTDPLTGLANRLGLYEQSVRLWERQRRVGGTVVVVLVDIDRFKDVNDTWGHAAGDALLRHVAGRLAPYAGRAGAVGRWGGEEFLLVVPGPPGSGERLGEQTRLALRQTWTRPVTVSVGVHEVTPGPVDDVEEALWRAVERADEALYEAKRAGRDRVAVR